MLSPSFLVSVWSWASGMQFHHSCTGKVQGMLDNKQDRYLQEKTPLLMHFESALFPISTKTFWCEVTRDPRSWGSCPLVTLSLDLKLQTQTELKTNLLRMRGLKLEGRSRFLF